MPIAVLTMTGNLKHSEEQAILSSPEEAVMEGSFPVFIGHPESWGSDRGQKLLRGLQSKSKIGMNFVDEMHQESLKCQYNCFRCSSNYCPKQRICRIGMERVILRMLTMLIHQMVTLNKNLVIWFRKLVMRQETLTGTLGLA